MSPSPAPSTPTSPPRSSPSSITMQEQVPDVEAQAPKGRLTHFQRVFDQAGVTEEVLNYDYRGKGTEEEPYLVEFLPHDARNPMTFPKWQKWTYMLLQAFACLAVTLVSTGYTGGVIDIIYTFNVSTEVAILGISLFVLGFAIGPLFWAPLSELYGRQILFFITFAMLTAFSAGAAGAKNIETLLIMRFLGGSFGSSPLTNAGGVIADMFTANDRGLASGIFAAAPFLGPSIGPIIGGFLGEAEGFRWVNGVMTIFTGILLIVVSLTVPETYAPVLLRRRAEKLSKITGKHYASKFDHLHPGRPKKSLGAEFKTALSRPWKLLFREPIVLLTAIYMAIVYGTLYMMFAAFPIVFQKGRGWSAGISGLAFCGITVGMMAAVSYSIYDNKRYAAVAAANGGAAPPEARLPPAIIGSVLLPVGLFWFAWTNGPSIHWIVPIIASSFFAMGLVLVFLSLMNYLIDSYVIFAASVLAANSVLRSLFGAAFPLFTTYMYNDLGIHWASSIPAFLSLACLPFPFLFYKYGAAIRMKCRYAAEAAAVLARMRGTAMEKNTQEARTSNQNNEGPIIDADEAEAEIERAITREREERRRKSSAAGKRPTLFGRSMTGGAVTDDELGVKASEEKP